MSTQSRFCLVSLAIVLAAGCAPSAALAQGGAGQTTITADYQINFVGMNLGKVRFASTLSDGAYTVRGGGRLEFIVGAFWKVTGGTRSKGVMTADGPQPAAFMFHFDNGKKSGKLDMTFKGNVVGDVVSDIPDTTPNHPRYIPVSKADMTGVLDPLSALFVAARGKGGGLDPSVCDTRIPVFDGKHRFDIALSHKQSVRVKESRNSGYGGPALVCQVKYVPISGYKETQEGVQFLARSDDIEVWLIPVAATGVYMPYHVRVPTLFGQATATASSVQVDTPGKQSVRLVRD